MPTPTLDFPRMPSLRMECCELRGIFGLESFQQREKEDTMLTQLLMDTFLNADLVQGHNLPSQLPRLAVVDEFSKAVAKIRKAQGHKLTTHTMFAVTVMKDIHQILGKDNVGRSYQELQDLASHCEDLVKHTDAKSPRGGGPYWLSGDMHYVNNMAEIIYYIKDWTLPQAKGLAIQRSPQRAYYVRPRREELPSWTEEYLTRLLSLNPKTDKMTSEQWEIAARSLNNEGISCVLPSNEPLLALQNNPLICGTLACNLSLLTEHAGIALANHHLSILYICHLYNAFQQKELLHGQWPDFEKVIDAHISSLFFGSRPVKPEDIYKRFCLRLGLRPSGARLNPEGKLKISALGGDGSTGRKSLSPSCLTATKVSETFNNYFGCEQDMIRSLYATNVLLQKKKKANSSRR